MNVSFDQFGQPEIPYILLCNPNKDELFSLGLAYNTKLTKRFNAISEFSFSFPKSIDGGQTTIEAYEYIQSKRLVLVEGYGYFQIVDPGEDLDGSVPIKNATCQSLETELVSKRITSYGGTKPLWNILASDGTVLQDMIDRAPNWSVGHVDIELLTLYRTFNVSDTNIYNFLVNDVSKAYECVFFFDTDNREINVYAVANATTNTDIFVSFDNLISTGEFNEKSDEIVTALSVYGGGTLNIRTVNPLGTDKIYDFSYYKNSGWMSSSLVSALTAWEIIVDTQQPIYADSLTTLQTYNAEMLDLRATLATLESEYLAIEAVQAVRIQAGTDYSDINAQLDAKKLEIESQEDLIANKQSQIDVITSELLAINVLVSFNSNFTSPQLLELDNYIFENTYKNENIIQTDSMTQVEIQEAAQGLYNQAQSVLARISQPRYEFSVNSVNYTILQNFEVFTDQTEVGALVTIEVKYDDFISAVLLEYEIEFQDPSTFKLTFSNRLRLDDGGFTYSDLQGQVVKTGSAVSFDSLKWSNWENDYKDDVTSFITSSLDASVNNLISNSNQDITITQNGLRARQWNGSSYDDKQMWMVNNMLAFSDDGFQTAKLALGEISLPSGGTGYGLVADVIVGRLLAGNTLTIANSENNFVLDETGATLNNAKFSIQTTNTKIIIDPTQTNSLVIQKNEGGTFNNKFWVDNSGNVNFAGNLSGATGTFSGTLSATVGNIGTLVIDANGLKTADGVNYLRGNGDLKWGGLSITGGTATFTGDVFANRIVGEVQWSQIVNAPLPTSKFNSGTGYSASGITTNTMSGNRILGGSPSVTTLSASSQVNIGGASLYTVGSSFEILIGGTVSIGSTSGGGTVSAGSGVTLSGGTLSINNGNIYVSGGFSGYGKTAAIYIPNYSKYMYFSNGILTGW